jgi:hypothetical protein
MSNNTSADETQFRGYEKLLTREAGYAIPWKSVKSKGGGYYEKII